MLYGPSPGETRNVGATFCRYVVTSAGRGVALSVRSKGAWKPRCERMAEPTAPCQSLMLTIVKPCPAPTAFHPTIPTGSHIWENATAVLSAVMGGAMLNATASSLVSRVTFPYGRSSLTSASGTCRDPPIPEIVARPVG